MAGKEESKSKLSFPLGSIGRKLRRSKQSTESSKKTTSSKNNAAKLDSSNVIKSPKTPSSLPSGQNSSAPALKKLPSSKLLQKSSHKNPFIKCADASSNGTVQRTSLPKAQINYNPYGIRSLASNDTATKANNILLTGLGSKKDHTFYLHEGSQRIRVPSIPVADPNEYIPEEFKQDSVQLFDRFKLEKGFKNLGTGCTAEVKRVTSLAGGSSNVYAFKKMNMIYDETDADYYRRTSREFCVARYLSSVSKRRAKSENSSDEYGIHIIDIFGLYKVPTTTSTSRGWGYVMELASCDLFSVITKVGWKTVPINEKYCIFKQICNGVKFMHDNGVAHRDLKPENVLLCGNGICKITDFGISNWYHTVPNDLASPIKECRGMIGTPPYAPPEVMMFDSKKGYPESVQKPCNPTAIDCYSLGIILMTLLNQTIPFLESCNKDARFREYESSYESYVNLKNKNFRVSGYHKGGPGIEYTFAKFFRNTDVARVAWRLADPKAESRYTIYDLFEDPWFDEIETCIDYTRSRDYLCKEPPAPRGSIAGMNIGDGNSTSSSVPAVPVVRKRSMVDIVLSPNVEEASLNDRSNTNTSSSLSSGSGTSLFSIVAAHSGELPSSSSTQELSVASTYTPISKCGECLFTVSENDEQIEQGKGAGADATEVLDESDSSDDEFFEVSEAVKALPDVPPVTESLKGKDIEKKPEAVPNLLRRSSTVSFRRKKVIHNHLNVVSSRVNIYSGYYTKNSPSTVGAPTGMGNNSNNLSAALTVASSGSSMFLTKGRFVY